MKHKLILLLIAIFGICFFSDLKSQQIIVSGIVSDGSGEPLIGASVVVKGTTNGVVADINGRYQL